MVAWRGGGGCGRVEKDEAEGDRAMKRVALFVGVDEYEDGSIARLEHAVDDAEALAAVFGTLLGFERVEKLRNPDGRKDILRKVEEVTRGLGAGDLFFFYFAGHGYRVKENHVLVCRGDSYEDLEDEYDGLPLGQLKKKARGPWDRMLVIDACQNDIRKTRGADEGVSGRDLALILDDADGEGGIAGEGVQVVVTSCSEGQKALEVGELGHGLFTSALLETVKAHAVERRRLDLDGFREEMGRRMGTLARKYRLQGRQNPMFRVPGECGIVLLEGEIGGQVPVDRGQGGGEISEVEVLRAEMERLRAEMARLEAERQKGRAGAPVPPIRVPSVGKEAEGERRAGETATIALPGGATMEMVWCPATTSVEWKRISGGKDYFLMGSPETEKGRYDDETQHRVRLTKGFWMGKYPVTQAQWKSVMGSNPSYFHGEDRPVECVSWRECQAFCRAAGQGLALPTEAQWEYACRAGSTGAYGGTGRLEDMGWFRDNSGDKTHPVGRKAPNAWGLHDMHGNVWEWCADWSGVYPREEVTDPKGASSGSYRVGRGGGWCDGAAGCRSAHRSYYSPSSTLIRLGFRLSRILS